MPYMGKALGWYGGMVIAGLAGRQACWQQAGTGMVSGSRGSSKKKN